MRLSFSVKQAFGTIPNRWGPPVLLLIGIIFFSGCGQRETAVDQATRNGILLLDNGAEPRDLDPHLVTGFPEHRVIKALLEGLVADHPSDSNRVVPGVAERWEANEDASIWTFHLRTDARWSNGDPVTAEDFAYAYQRLLNPALAAPYVEMLALIRGAAAFNRGDHNDWSQVGVSVLDNFTLRFELNGPTPYFPLLLTHYTYFPVHRPTIEKHNAFARRGSGWTRAGNFVGNGPFILTEWRPNQRIVVEKNPYYWDADSVRLNGIHFFPFQDRQMAHRAFMAGQIHKTDNVPFNMRDRLREQQHPALRDDPFFVTNYMGLNVRNPGLDDRRVRQALLKALDLPLIIERVTKNGTVAGGFVPPGIAGYPTADAYVHDPDQARALLAEAGFPQGAGFPTLVFITANADTSRTFAEVVQSMWSRELGIQVRIENKEWQVLISEMDSGNFDVFSIAWVGDYMDPATFLKIMRSGGGNNRTGFAHPEYDALLDAANQQADPEKRFQILSSAEAILLHERPILPVAWVSNLYLLHPDVQGWSSTKYLADIPYKSLWLDSTATP